MDDRRTRLFTPSRIALRHGRPRDLLRQLGLGFAPSEVPGRSVSTFDHGEPIKELLA